MNNVNIKMTEIPKSPVENFRFDLVLVETASRDMELMVAPWKSLSKDDIVTYETDNEFFPPEGEDGRVLAVCSIVPDYIDVVNLLMMYTGTTDLSQLRVITHMKRKLEDVTKIQKKIERL